MAYCESTRKRLICLQKSDLCIYVVSNPGSAGARRSAVRPRQAQSVLQLECSTVHLLDSALPGEAFDIALDTRLDVLSFSASWRPAPRRSPIAGAEGVAILRGWSRRSTCPRLWGQPHPLPPGLSWRDNRRKQFPARASVYPLPDRGIVGDRRHNIRCAAIAPDTGPEADRSGVPIVPFAAHPRVPETPAVGHVGTGASPVPALCVLVHCLHCFAVDRSRCHESC